MTVLVIIGVHTPEFDHEKVLENVQNAVERYSVDWAVVQDNDFATWRAYKNRYWPAKYLIDKDGVIRYTHFGEGAYIETEHQIRDLLEEAGADLSVLNPSLPDNQPLDPGYLKDRSAGLTRELYAGYERGSSDLIFGGGGFVGDQDYYGSLGNVVVYEDTDEHESHLLYLQGALDDNPGKPGTCPRDLRLRGLHSIEIRGQKRQCRHEPRGQRGPMSRLSKCWSRWMASL